MKISFSFYSVKDLSDLSNGEKLLEILSTHRFVVEKAGDSEPIRKDFIAKDFPEIWKGRGIDGGFSSCCFLFKGKIEVKFIGMVTWNRNLPSNTKAFNGIHLWLNVPNNYNINKLIQLGDDIFEWSGAVYGYITEESKDPSYDVSGNIHLGLPGLLWVNYYGSPYVAEPEFNVSADHKSIGNGVRVMMSETPYDERLNDSDYMESMKNMIGIEWFWQHPRKYKIKVPVFDKSAITKSKID